MDFWRSKPVSAATAAEQTVAGVQLVQQQRSLLRINAIADSCFRECIDDFSLTKHLRPAEEHCLQCCVDKYMLLLASGGQAFAASLSGQS